jgi:hypothetical protein
MASFLDTLFASFDEKTARAELENALRQVQSMKDTLAAYEQWREGTAGSRSHGGEASRTTTHSASGSDSTSSSTGRGRASRVLIMELIRREGPGVDWTTKAVREGLGLEENSDHGIQIALSRLYRSDELERPRKGVYRLPRNRASEDGEGEGMGLLPMPPEKGSG